VRRFKGLNTILPAELVSLGAGSRGSVESEAASDVRLLLGGEEARALRRRWEKPEEADGEEEGE
jgi:hypothetical protein